MVDGDMDVSTQLLVFSVERQRFAVPLSRVSRVLAAVELTPVPGAPAVVVGVFYLHGDVVPVLDRRHRPASLLRTTDHFVVVRTASRTLALWADDVAGVVDAPAADLDALASPPAGPQPFQGATRLEGDLVLIHDVDLYLQSDEEQALQEACEAMR